MKTTEPPDLEAFNKLLFWLNPDRDKAAEKYETIRVRLMKIFACKGCRNTDELADLTFDRVMSKIDWLLENYEGDPAIYHYSVAKYIYLENRDRDLLPNLPPPDPPDRDKERIASCLERALLELDEDERKLALRYLDGEGQVRIQNRKQIAKEYGISINALRIKVFKINSKLKPHFERCLEEFSDE